MRLKFRSTETQATYTKYMADFTQAMLEKYKALGREIENQPDLNIKRELNAFRKGIQYACHWLSEKPEQDAGLSAGKYGAYASWSKPNHNSLHYV